MRSRWGGLWLLVVLAVLGAARAQAAPPYTQLQAAYCTQQGGIVQTRVPEYGTNGGVPLVLAGPQGFCAFYSHTDGSSIFVLLNTLTTTQPTLAALAYYAMTPFVSKGCNGSPGSCYCSQIGGTDLFGGVNAAGGGWVLRTNANSVLDSCIFPDESSIDSYGLYYHSAGIIRGANLAGILRYPNPY